MEGRALQPVLLALAAIGLGFAIHIKDGEYTRGAIAIVTIALALCFAGTLVPLGRRRVRQECRALRWVLAAGLMLELAALFMSSPGVDLRAGVSLFGFRMGILLSAVFVATIVFGHERLQIPGFFLLLMTYLVMGASMIHASPNPHIDVFVFQQEGARELLSGRNPYEMTYPDIYRSDLPGARQVYGAGLTQDGRLRFGFPYMPLSLFIATAGYRVVGDYRYALLIATSLAAALMALSRTGQTSALASALFLFTPRSFFILTRGWTEPLLVLLLAATVFCAFRRLRVLPLALGLLLAGKQYLLFALPAVPLLCGPRADWRCTARLLCGGLLFAFVVAAPLAMWNLQAFYHSTALVQQISPYRTDALSYLNGMLDLRGALPRDGSALPAGHVPSMRLAFVALGCGIVLAVWRAPRTPAGFAAALALIYLLFIAFNKQAFANYYYFVIGALCCAVAAAAPQLSDERADGCITALAP